MSVQEQKKKTKKTYEQLLEEARSIASKTAAAFVPELCQVLKEQCPELSNKEIQQRVKTDCEGIWVDVTIRNAMPSWVKNPKAIEGQKSTKKVLFEEHRREENLKKLEKTFDEIPEPPAPQLESEESEGFIVDDPLLEKFEGSDKTTLTKLGDCRDALRETWKAFTEKEFMPHLDDDLILDHIKPTREYRKFVYELNKGDRAGLNNWIVPVIEVLNDMLEIIEEADKK